MKDMAAHYDVIIIGAGVMGAATAYYLSKKGKKILLLEQYEIKNTLNASRDYSRAIRYEYGDDEFYVNLAVESVKLWQTLEQEYGKQIYFPCGGLSFSNVGDSYIKNTHKTLNRLGYGATLLDESTIKRRYPQFRASYGVFDPHAGILEAHTATDAFVELARSYGATVREHAQVVKTTNGSVTLENNEYLQGDLVILTTNAWTNKILPNPLPLKIEKKHMLFFKPKSPALFEKSTCPIFYNASIDIYGFPMHGIQAVKVAQYYKGTEGDPDDRSRDVSSDYIAKFRKVLSGFIPTLADAEVIEIKTCFTDTTPDEDFLIGFLNEWTVVACGFSGHGFKFAPVIGTILTELALTGKTSFDISRFSLNRFSSKL